MKLLDRYVLRNFLEPFLICFFGFLAIWLIFDLTDNGSEFVQAHASVKTVAIFYATQLPQIILISLPVGILLARSSPCSPRAAACRASCCHS